MRCRRTFGILLAIYISNAYGQTPGITSITTGVSLVNVVDGKGEGMKPLLFVFACLLSITVLKATSVDPVVTEGIVNAPIEEVWKSFSTKEGIESWMVAKTDFELRVGATWRTSYSKDSNLNDDASIHHIILAYDPGRMLAFRTIKTPGNFPFPNAISKTWNVIYFEPAGTGRTKVTTHMLGFEDNEESQKMRTFFEAGNKTTMDNLIRKYK